MKLLKQLADVQMCEHADEMKSRVLGTKSFIHSFVIAFLLICMFAHLYICTFAQQVFINNGASVTQMTNAVLFIKGGGLTNQNKGLFNNSGKIILTGDWLNNAANVAFTSNNGTVELSGANEDIGGSNTTDFNNLTLSGSGTKRLNINTLVGGGYPSPTGVLALNDRPLELNSKTLIVSNPATTAITRTSGYAISETEPAAGYGKIQWNIAAAASGSNYEYPFGTVTGTYIPFEFNVTTSGTQSGTGSMTVATYSTDVTANPNNRPLPTSVTNFLNNAGNEDAPKAVDRFWITDASNYTTNPTATLVFTYRDEECDAIGGSTNTIKEDSLKAERWNSAWVSPVGTDNSTANTVTAMNLNIFSIWRLSEVQELITPVIWVPSAFSPGSTHGNNILHVLGKGIKELKLVIYDRWGEKVFEKTDNDITTGWDGTYNGKPMNTAVFAYYLTATLTDGTPVTQKGNVSLIR